VIGVLGGIASGKSEVARALAGPQGLVIDADRLAHEVLDLPECVQRRARATGRRRAVGRRPRRSRGAGAQGVRRPQSSSASSSTGSIPPSARTSPRSSRPARAARTPRVVLDVPLLLENDAQHHLVSECDALVFVDAAQDVRSARAVAARGWSPGELARREATQMPLAAKLQRARYVVCNDGSLTDLRARVQNVVREIESARARAS
jgi:dephospho-CoA kinase